MSQLEELFSLAGKTAVVIGGTGELCGAMALAMASAGAEVVLVGRNEEKANARLAEIAESGGKGYFVAADVTSRDRLEELLATVIGRSERCHRSSRPTRPRCSSPARCSAGTFSKTASRRRSSMSARCRE
jgi:NAD(P)-dependent dehydrogenase (short-subunit alcohol dehydrogenase family)